MEGLILYIAQIYVAEPLFLIAYLVSNLVVSIYELITSKVFLYGINVFLITPLVMELSSQIQIFETFIYLLFTSLSNFILFEFFIEPLYLIFFFNKLIIDTIISFFKNSFVHYLYSIVVIFPIFFIEYMISEQV